MQQTCSRAPLLQDPEIPTTRTFLEHYSEPRKIWENEGKWVKMCRFRKLSGKMVINHPKKGGMWWFSVLMGHRGWVYWAMAKGKMGGNWGKRGKVGKNRAEVGDTWGGRMKGLHAVHWSPRVGPLSQCCLFSPMDHVHPYRGGGELCDGNFFCCGIFCVSNLCEISHTIFRPLFEINLL